MRVQNAWNDILILWVKSKEDTEYSNLPVFHSPLYNMRASSMLRKEQPYEKKIIIIKEKKIINTFVLK